MYFDVENVDNAITLNVNMTKRTLGRFWEVRVTQIPFAQRSPYGCQQYHVGTTGVVQTMNFADNGRHLANQDYNVCIRQEEGMCSITYEPCDENSFRVNANVGGLSESTGMEPPQTSSGSNPETGSNSAGDDQVMAADSTGEIVEGSGDGTAEARSMDVCADRIILPCDTVDLIMVSNLISR